MADRPIDPLALLQKYYPSHSRAGTILLSHSRCVARRALAIAGTLPQLDASERAFIEQAALLHDIGIFCCHAPGLGCYGSEPYIRHGLCGAAILRDEGLPRHALVCENHIGVGLTAADIVRQKLPLPIRDMVPTDLAQQLVAYADLFYSKNPQQLQHSRTAAQVCASLASFGNDKVALFHTWQHRFEPQTAGEPA